MDQVKKKTPVLNGNLAVRQAEQRLSPEASIESSGDEGSAFQRAAIHWDLEQDYEQRPRKRQKSDRENIRLPIKTAEGEIKQLDVPEVEVGYSIEVQDEGSSDDIFDSESDVIPEGIPEISERQQILEAKEELARIATLISEDPEEHVRSCSFTVLLD
jgi:nucleolar complex protein 3